MTETRRRNRDTAFGVQAWLLERDLLKTAITAVAVLGTLALAACGATIEQKAASGAVAGAVVGGPVGAAVGGAAGTAVGQSQKPR